MIVSFASSAFAQDVDPRGLTATSKAYRVYRLTDTEPPYSLTKVKSLIKKIKSDSQDNQVMSARQFNALSLNEKFTYTMLHGENFSQNCSGMPGILGEEKKIFAYVPKPFYDQETWSERQRGFLKKNRNKVIGLLRSTMRARNRVGVNLKQAILELGAVELIPDMASVYNRNKKDQDILTVFMVLMKDGHYRPFLASTTFKKLYGDESTSYKAFIEANAANQKLIIQRAMAFYKSRKQ